MTACIRRQTSPAQNDSFREWWGKLRELAAGSHHQLGVASEYQEYFEDGDSPEETLGAELRLWKH